MRTSRQRLLSVLVLSVTLALWGVLRPTDGEAAPALPGDPCQVEPRPGWSGTETWVWRQICVGAVADLNAHFGQRLDPRSAGVWTEERKLSAAFLETMLTHDPWRSAIPRHGVRILGAWFYDKINLEGAMVDREFRLDASRFASDLNLTRIRAASALSLKGSLINGTLRLSSTEIEGEIHLIGAKVAGTLDMDAADIGQNVLMRSDSRVAEHQTEFNDVILRGAKIGGQVDLRSAKVSGRLNMDSVDIGQILLVSSDRSMSQHRAEFNDVVLNGAEVSGQISLVGAKVNGTLSMASANIGDNLLMVGAKIDGTLNMDGVNIGQSLLMRSNRVAEHRSDFSDVVLRGAKIGGQVDLVGAKVNGTLDMEAVDIGRSLLMASDSRVAEHQAEFNDVVLRGAKVGGQVALIGAKVNGTLNMDSVAIGQILLMRSDSRVAKYQAEFDDVILKGAKVGGQVDLIGAKVAGDLAMHSADIGQDLLMQSVSEHRAEFNDVVLNGAKVGGQISLVGAKVTGRLAMDSADIGQSLLMASDSRVAEHQAEFNDVVLPSAKIGGQVSLVGAKINGTLNMDSASVGNDLFLRGGQFSKKIQLNFVEIGGNLDLRGAKLTEIDLTGAAIRSELRLASGSWQPLWGAGAGIVLRNARAAAVQDEPLAWPETIDLDGFVYGRLGGLGADESASVRARGSDWFVNWLARDKPYSPQPYQQLASVLRGMGNPEMADDVLYAGRERERQEAWQREEHPRWIFLSLLKWTIGYGLGPRYFRALCWVIALVLIGAIVLGVTGQNQRDNGKCIGIWYSLDTLLPIIQLRKSHYDIDLEGFARYWFYGHKLMGYVLASFLIAGLAGLTK